PLFDQSRAGMAVVRYADAGFALGAGTGLGGGAGAAFGAATGACLSGGGGGAAVGRGGGATGRGGGRTSETTEVDSAARDPKATPPVDSPASVRLGDGIFLRIASVSISNPVVKTSSSSDGTSSLSRSSS